MIKVQTISMGPGKQIENLSVREAIEKSALNDALIKMESSLRKLAYSGSSLHTVESFFNDSDMKSNYFLVVVYDSNRMSPLLSCRYYYDHTAIENCIYNPLDSDSWCDIRLDAFPQDKIFLADRLSGNKEDSIFQANRAKIFSLFYKEIFFRNHPASFILMAKKERNDRLLTKYLRIGLNIAGETTFRNHRYWILLGNLDGIYTYKKIHVIHDALMLMHVKWVKTANQWRNFLAFSN